MSETRDELRELLDNVTAQPYQSERDSMVWLMAKVILELRDMSDITRKMADAQEKGERPCPCKRCLELERKVASRELHVKQLLDEIDHLRTEIAARDGY